MKTNNKYIQDKYWLHLKDVIISSDVRRFDDTSVRYLANTLRNRMGMPANASNASNAMARPIMRSISRPQALTTRQTFF